MVERDGFEIRCTRKGTQGSNPWLSAKQTENPAIGWVFCLSVPGALAALDSQRHALTTTNAQCRQTLVGIPALHFVQQADQNPAA